MKKTLSLFILLALIFTSCSLTVPVNTGEKLNIVTTLFPQYDFARAVAGGRADVTMLLEYGMESHDYSPSPADIMKIGEANLFIYTGELMEVWADKILESADVRAKIETGELMVLDLSDDIELVEYGEHDSADGHADHKFDPHIWTSPKNAISIVGQICGALVSIDPDGAEYYKNRQIAYVAQLNTLDSNIRETVENSEIKTLYFGGSFAFTYFCHEYGLDYVSAYDSCSSESEPSAATVTQIIDKIRASGAKVVLYGELSEPRIATTIASETGAQLMLFHSVHNISKTEAENGATYLSLMQSNLDVLKIALNPSTADAAQP